MYYKQIQHVNKNSTTKQIIIIKKNKIIIITTVVDLETNKGGWLDWDGVNWPVVQWSGRLNSKCHYEYQEMCGWGGGGASYPIHPLDPPLYNNNK